MTLGHGVCDKRRMVNRITNPSGRKSGPSPSSPAPKGATTERKIYVLPAEQVERIKHYQNETGISSEVEAVRRLLDIALEMRDSVESLLTKLQSRFAVEKDLRVLARDILAGHSRVRSITYPDDGLEFTLGADERGKIDKRGRIYIGGPGWDSWDEIKPYKDQKKSDLDDDIPF
jgi:hypothetical protein